MSEWKHAKEYSLVNAKYEFIISEEVNGTFNFLKSHNVDTVGDMFREASYNAERIGAWVDKYGIETVYEAYQDWLVAREKDAEVSE